ncbi:MAG: histidine kinase [Antricoccus sp.]
MQLNPAQSTHELSVARRLIPFLAAIFGVLAIVVDPTRFWWRVAVLLVPIALFAAWYRWAISLSFVALGVFIAVPIAQWAGELEPSMFLVSVLALCAVGWEPNRFLAYAIIVLCVVTPLVLSMALPFASISWAPWVGGTIYPAVLGWTIRRQEALTVELARARSELAERAVLDERRRVARDVHDLVGHGLAAVLLQGDERETCPAARS